jgi:hypothetical protein
MTLAVTVEFIHFFRVRDVNLFIQPVIPSHIAVSRFSAGVGG